MDYHQNVVIDYLRADRAIFVNAEYCIQPTPADNPDSGGPHWYCDAIAADFRSRTIFLCEVSYAAQLYAMAKRLRDWHGHWTEVGDAVRRDSYFDQSWGMRPWLFVPEKLLPVLLKRLANITDGQQPNFTPGSRP